jgi:hypothetical protein
MVQYWSFMSFCGCVAILELQTFVDVLAVLELCTYMAVLQYWNYWPCGKNRESAADS